MKRFALPAAIFLLGIASLTVASQESALAMSGAANKWLAALTPQAQHRTTLRP